jgi:hexokinase
VTDGAPHGRCREGVAAGIAAVLGDEAASKVVLELSEDGSGLGAAVIACTASSV